MMNNNLLPEIPFYNNSLIFNQLYTLKSYEVLQKKLIFFGNATPIDLIPISKKWFSKWKKITCYEAIKDMINIEIPLLQNCIFNSYFSIVQSINYGGNDQLDSNMHNESIYEKSSGNVTIKPESNFELINPELYNLLLQNTNQNNNNMINVQGYCIKNMIIFDLNQLSFYVLYWKKEEQTLGKMILIFNDFNQKIKIKQNLIKIGMLFFCASFSIEINKPRGEVNCGDIKFNYLNKDNSVIIKKLPPVGLANIGNTCYMNAALQCVSNVDKLSNFLLDQKNVNLIKKNKENILVEPYIEVLENLYRKTPESEDDENFTYSPKYIRDVFYSNNLFQGNAGDSIDLIMYFLQKMHEELNKIPGNLNPFFSKYYINNTYNSNMDQYEITSLNNFIQNSSGQNITNSIISNTFFVIECSKTKCYNCKRCGYDFQFKNYIIFPLEEIRKNTEISRGISLSSVTLYDCFIYYEKTNYFTGTNRILCNKCGYTSDAENSSFIYSVPDTLIINLNRGIGNIYNVGIEYDENLDLEGFVKYDGDSKKYKLTGIVTHVGSSGVGGHYMAFCYKEKYNRWYLFNDAIVSESDFNTAKSTGDSYILFYRRVNNK